MLGRLNKTAQAEQWLRRLSEKHPHDAETWALLGRIEKDRWISLWRQKNKTKEEMLDDARFESAQLNEAIQAYRQGFIEQPDNYYAGINALTMSHMLTYLGGGDDNQKEQVAMAGGVRWAVKCHSARKINDLIRSRGSPVWQQGFHDHALRREEDAVHVARYIVANPLRAGLVGRIGDYPLWDAAWL